MFPNGNIGVTGVGGTAAGAVPVDRDWLTGAGPLFTNRAQTVDNCFRKIKHMETQR